MPRAFFLHLLSCSVSYLCWNIQPIYFAKNVYFHIATTDFCRFQSVRAFFICSHHAQWPVESLCVMTLEQSHSCSFFSTLIWFNGWKIGLHPCLWCFMEEIFSFDGKWNWPNVFYSCQKRISLRWIDGIPQPRWIGRPLARNARCNRNLSRKKSL